MFRIFKNKVFKILGKNVKNGGTLLKIDFKDDPDYIYGELESALMTADPGLCRSRIRPRILTIFYQGV